MHRCPCGFAAGPSVRWYSAAWYVAHERHHLEVFPDVDVTTRLNLADATARARAAER